MKVNGKKYILLVLYVNDILFASNDTNMLVDINQLLFDHFDMKDLGEPSYISGIQIFCDKPSGTLKLSQYMYIGRIPEKV